MIDANDILIVKTLTEKESYYLSYGKRGIFDKNIANLLGIHTTRYRNILAKQFNADKSNREVYFDRKEDAEAAIEWIKSALLMNELKGDKHDI